MLKQKKLRAHVPSSIAALRALGRAIAAGDGQLVATLARAHPAMRPMVGRGADGRSSLVDPAAFSRERAAVQWEAFAAESDSGGGSHARSCRAPRSSLESVRSAPDPSRNPVSARRTFTQDVLGYP